MLVMGFTFIKRCLCPCIASRSHVALHILLLTGKVFILYS